MHEWIKFGCRVLLHAIQHHPGAEVRLPSGEEINACIDAIAANCPLLGEKQAWAAADGLKLPL